MAQQLPPAFQKVVNSLRANRTGLVTAYGIYYWDMLAVARLEYRYVWKARTTPIKVFFLLNRYITLVMGFANAYLTMNHIPVDMCKKMVSIQPLFSTTIITLCGCISTIRVYAIWNKDKRILALLCSVLIACTTVMIYVSTQQQALFLPEFLTEQAGFSNCLSTRTDCKAAIFDLLMWLPPLVFDSVVLTLTVYRYFDLRHRTGGIEIPILRKIAIKHVWYFGIMATTNCVNVAFFAREQKILRDRLLLGSTINCR